MTKTTTLDIQRRLLALGFDPGPLDGVPGRNSIAATEAFQAAHPPLVIDGLVGPKTLAALNAASVPVHPALETEIMVPWIENVMQHINLQEARDNKKLRDYLDSDGRTVGDPRLVPWCGDIPQTAFAITLPAEPLPANPWYALNWAEWGVAVPTGMVPYGALGTKRRFDSQGRLVGGHVFFIIGHDATHFHSLAGNTNNAIGIALIPKSDLYATLRWPRTYPAPTHSMPLTTIDATIAASEA